MFFLALASQNTQFFSCTGAVVRAVNTSGIMRASRRCYDEGGCEVEHLPPRLPERLRSRGRAFERRSYRPCERRKVSPVHSRRDLRESRKLQRAHSSSRPPPSPAQAEGRQRRKSVAKAFLGRRA